MIFQSFKMALKAIAGNKMRSFLTILGVVIGVLAIVVLVSIGQGANSSVTASIEGMGTNLISATINARRTNPVTADGLNELAENEAIAYIAPLTNVSGTVKAGVNTYDDGTVQGTAPGYEHIRNWTVAEGRFLTQPDIDNRSFVAVIGAEAASEMYGTTHAVGETFTLSGYTMTVIGVLATNGESASGSNDERVRRIQRELAANRDTMLIFDEADHLYGWDVKKFEIIRQLWDETNTPIVLVGPPRLEEILTHGSGRSNLSQLYRRKYEIKLTGIKPDEVRAILAQYDVEPRVAAELTLIATDTRHGGMGNFIEIFGMCLEAAAGGTVTQEILAGAKCYKLQG